MPVSVNGTQWKNFRRGITSAVQKNKAGLTGLDRSGCAVYRALGGLYLTLAFQIGQGLGKIVGYHATLL